MRNIVNKPRRECGHRRLEALYRNLVLVYGELSHHRRHDSIFPVHKTTHYVHSRETTVIEHRLKTFIYSGINTICHSIAIVLQSIYYKIRHRKWVRVVIRGISLELHTLLAVTKKVIQDFRLYGSQNLVLRTIDKFLRFDFLLDFLFRNTFPANPVEENLLLHIEFARNLLHIDSARYRILHLGDGICDFIYDFSSLDGVLTGLRHKHLGLEVHEILLVGRNIVLKFLKRVTASETVRVLSRRKQDDTQIHSLFESHIRTTKRSLYSGIVPVVHNGQVRGEFPD